MQTQKDDETHAKSDFFVDTGRPTRKNAAKLGQTAMRAVHCGHAGNPIASHLQHDYLAVIAGK